MRGSTDPGDAARKPSVVGATLWTFGVNVGTAMLSLVNVLIVARTLGPAGRGEVVFLLTIMALTSRLSNFGISEANVNFASREPRVRPSLATNSALLACAFGWGAGALVWVVAEISPAFGGHTPSGLRALAVASIPILVLQGALYRLIQADYRFAFSNVSMVVPPVVNLAANLALALAGAMTPARAVVAWIGAQLLATVLLTGYVQTKVAGFGRPDLQLARRALSFGIKSHLGRVMQLGNFRLDQWFVGSLAGQRELGLYSVAVAWFDALTFLPTALAMVLRPDMVRAQPHEAAARAATAFRVTGLITLLFALGTVVLAPVLCVTVFGEEFRGAVDDLRILAFGAIGIAAMRVFGSTLTAQQRPLLETAGVGVGLVVTIVLDILLIPGNGGTGAAIASTFAYTAGGLAMIAIFVRTLGARWDDLRPGRADLEVIRARLLRR